MAKKKGRKFSKAARIRDVFAGLAMLGILCNADEYRGAEGDGGEGLADGIAKRAYWIADMMLKHRG